MSALARQNPTHPTPDSDLSPVQQQVIAALAKGRTITAAAAEVQLHRCTVHAWMNTLPAFRAALSEARSQYAAQLRDEMTELSGTALETMRGLLQNPQTPPFVRLRASLAILERQDWSLPADAERNSDREMDRERDRELKNLDREIKQQLLAIGRDPRQVD